MARHRMLRESIRPTGRRLAVFTFDRQDVLDLAEHARTAPHHLDAPAVVFALETHAALISTGRSRPRPGIRWPAERITYAYEDGDQALFALVMAANRGDFRATFLPETAQAAANEAIATVGVVIYDEDPLGASLEADPVP